MINVISLGNDFCGDDGIGPRVLERLTKHKFPTPMKFINAGEDAFILLEYLVQSDPVLLIDCARMGLAPGTIRRFNAGDVLLRSAEQLVTMHGFSFAEIFNMAKSIGEPAPCTIFGIEPKDVQMGTSLSEEVEKSIPGVVNMILEEIEGYAKSENTYH